MKRSPGCSTGATVKPPTTPAPTVGEKHHHHHQHSAKSHGTISKTIHKPPPLRTPDNVEYYNDLPGKRPPPLPIDPKKKGERKTN